jgi:hypothetical protein
MFLDKECLSMSPLSKTATAVAICAFGLVLGCAPGALGASAATALAPALNDTVSFTLQ